MPVSSRSVRAGFRTSARDRQAAAINLAASQGVRVVSMSWNGAIADFNAAGVQTAIQGQPNVLFAALAGGNGGPTPLPDSQRPCGLSVPASNAGVDNVICVST